MPFGNVNVSYTPCRSVGQLKYAANYIFGRNCDQLKNGVIKTAPNLYMALGCNRENFENNVLVTRKLNGLKSSKGNAILAYKMSISFHPNDNVDYITAYQIARDLLRNLLTIKATRFCSRYTQIPTMSTRIFLSVIAIWRTVNPTAAVSATFMKCQSISENNA